MYEIWSLGHKPFEDLSGNKVLNPLQLLATACVTL